MKRLPGLGISLLLLVLIPARLGAGVRQWTTAGPEAASITALASHPSGIVYAALFFDGLVYKSTDAGQTWTLAINGLTDLSILTLAIDPTNPDVVYAGTQLGAMFKTTNGGTSWSRIGTGLPATTTVEQIAIDPTQPSTLYAAINVIFLDARGGIYKSTNGGSSWTAVNTGIRSVRMSTVAIDPVNSSTVYAGCSYRCESDFHLFKSTNGGASWSDLTIAQNALGYIYGVAVNPRNSSQVYAMTDLGSVYRSSNGGSTWLGSSGLPTVSSGRAFAIDAKEPSTLYYGASNGVYRSTNGGANWSLSSSGIAFGSRVTAIAAMEAGVLAATDGDGVYRSTNAAAAWALSNRGLRTTIRALTVDPRFGATVYAGTTASHLFRSTNSASSWARFSQMISREVDAIAVDPRSSLTIYVGTGGGNGFYKSTNGGASWTSPSFLSYVNALAIDPSAPDTLYAEARDRGLLKSTDAGRNWTTINNGLGFTVPIPRILDINVDPINPSTVYAVISGSGVAKTTNGGADWTKVNSGLTSLNVFDLSLDPVTPGIAYVASAGGIFKTTDGAATWSASNNGLSGTGTFSVAVDPVNPSTLYAGTSTGVFRSTDGGANWSAFSSEVEMRNVFVLAVDTRGNAIYAGTAAGAFAYQFTAPPPTGRPPGRRR